MSWPGNLKSPPSKSSFKYKNAAYLLRSNGPEFPCSSVLSEWILAYAPGSHFCVWYPIWTIVFGSKSCTEATASIIPFLMSEKISGFNSASVISLSPSWGKTEE